MENTQKVADLLRALQEQLAVLKVRSRKVESAMEELEELLLELSQELWTLS